MKKYYYSDGENQFGPYSVEELKKFNLTKETLIWFEGLENWITSNEVEELKVLFKIMPPPLIKTVQDNHVPKKVNFFEKNYKNLILAGIILVIITIVLALKMNSNIPEQSNTSLDSEINNKIDENTTEYSVDSDNSYSQSSEYVEPTVSQKTDTPKPRQKSEEELKEELHQKEIKKPKDHLSVSYRLNYKVFSGKDEIVGVIYNSASMATFKDIVLTVVYSTETEAELYRENYIIYKYVYSNGEIPFSIKTYSPSGTKKIGVYISSAKGE